MEFLPKHCVCHKNMACHTEELTEKDFKILGEIGNKLESEKAEECMEEYQCTCFVCKLTALMTTDGQSLVLSGPELDEILRKNETKISEEECNKDNVMWNSDWMNKEKVNSEWGNQGLRNIWSGGEVYEESMNLTGNIGCYNRPSPELLEDINKDGDQLLFDLESIEKMNLEELPQTEVSSNIHEMVSLFTTPKESNARPSLIAAHVDEMEMDTRNSWSFASHLEEDRLIQMPNVRTLRFVALQT